jgi:hypothetical protein
MKQAKVTVPKSVMEGLEAVRLSGKTNMFHVPMVLKLASDMGFSEAAIWISEHKNLYCQGLLRGFEPSASLGGEDGQPHVATNGTDIR